MLVLPEIWAQIFSFLIPTYGRIDCRRDPYKSLRMLCLVSHEFRMVAQPLLYNTIFLVDRGHNKELKLLRTLCQAPWLAHSVRSLTLSDLALQDQSLPGQKQLIDDTIRSLQIPPSLRGRLESSMEESYSETVPFLSLVVALTAHVRHVSVTNTENPATLAWLLSGSAEIDDYDDDQSFQKYTNYGLPHLRDLSFFGESQVPLSISALEPVLLRSGLKSLCLGFIDWRSDQINKMQFAHRTSDLPAISLQHAAVDGNSLRDIFTRFPRLRSLSISLADAYLEFSDSNSDSAEEDG
ncbi:hypothetical protein GQ53DRAFT_827404 [Thozetella sp. PMI_491]|nr:hypothetical protein GQ53DRAFT_827404 [Thozetella sp. PMI_491]